MKKLIYILLVPLMLGLGGCDDGTPDPLPVPDPEPPTPSVTLQDVTMSMKSDINGVKDADITKEFNLARLNIYNSDDVLTKSVESLNVSEVLKSVKLENGTYTFVLVGNVPEENITKSEIGKTKLSETNISLLKKSESNYFSPVGDVLYAKTTITVSETSKNAEFRIARTLPTMLFNVNDNTNSVSKLGVMLRDVATTLPLSTGSWTGKGDMFISLDAAVKSATLFKWGISCASSTSVEVNKVAEPPTKFDIIAQDATGGIIFNKQVSYKVPESFSGKVSSVECGFDFTKDEESSFLGISNNKYELGDALSHKSPISDSNIKTEESSTNPESNLADDDWKPIPIPPVPVPPTPIPPVVPEYPVKPEVNPEDWGDSSGESVDFGGDDKDEISPNVKPEDWNDYSGESVDIVTDSIYINKK